MLSNSYIYDKTIPSGEATLTIVPSILTGKLLPRDTNYYNFSNNEITYEINKKNFRLSKQNHIFSILNKNQYKVGIMGIYHRYCNIFYLDINDCHELNDEQYTIKNLGLRKYLIYSIIDIFPANTKLKIFDNINSSNFNKVDVPNLRIKNIKDNIKYFPELLKNNDFIFLHVACHILPGFIAMEK